MNRVADRAYTLFRFRSVRPVHITPDELIGDELLTNRDEGDTLVGLQLPRHYTETTPRGGGRAQQKNSDV
jgi:hypothetical protein